MNRPDAVRFDDPWHAQVFALTVALSEAGHFSWAEWTQAFGASLKGQAAAGALDGGDDYFTAWLETLERLLAGRDLVGSAEAAAMRDAWERAYLATPHGQSVRLSDGSGARSRRAPFVT